MGKSGEGALSGGQGPLALLLRYYLNRLRRALRFAGQTLDALIRVHWVGLILLVQLEHPNWTYVHAGSAPGALIAVYDYFNHG